MRSMVWPPRLMSLRVCIFFVGGEKKEGRDGARQSAGPQGKKTAGVEKKKLPDEAIDCDGSSRSTAHANAPSQHLLTAACCHTSPARRQRPRMRTPPGLR